MPFNIEDKALTKNIPVQKILFTEDSDGRRNFLRYTGTIQKGKRDTLLKKIGKT